ncbi:MAG TPA: TIGR03842 family LLM class F420-dependent oxidoreductase [Chloroflexota bacterium]
MKFGITLKPEADVQRMVRLARSAEARGFDYCWLFDSHVIWPDPYPLLTLIADATERLRLGTCVTNPGTREPSVTASSLALLQIVSGGRMELGIGRGDSARRVLGRPPTTLATLEAATLAIRELAEGRSVDLDGTTLRLPWASGDRLPVWIAGYGPKALALTGRIADGAIIQIADPDLIGWCTGLLREGAVAAGRDPAAIAVMAAAPAHVGPRAAVRERVRWFPALVSNHVVDLLKRYDATTLPVGLTAYVQNRAGYDYHHHAEAGSTNAQFVDDESVDRFCVVGEVDEHIQRLRRLAEVGVDQFNIYLMNGDEEETLDIYGREIIPELRRAGRAPS